jgi:hypothetical protein
VTWASSDQSVAFVTGSGQVFALKQIFLLGLAGGTGPVQLDAGNASRHPTTSSS